MKAKTAELTVSGDVGRLDQVLSNLIANALLHTLQGEQVSLQAERHDGHVRIIVADTAEGITAEELPYIFEHFWRGDVPRTHVNGAGLGLAIAKQLIDVHQGTIDVTSTPNSGTRFTISIPAI